jgi:hypothetical protein
VTRHDTLGGGNSSQRANHTTLWPWPLFNSALSLLLSFLLDSRAGPISRARCANYILKSRKLPGSKQ